MNLAQDDRVSLTIDHDAPDIMAITGLSMAARAQAVVDRTKRPKYCACFHSNIQSKSSPPVPMPGPDDVRIFRVTPSVISVLDYSKGFGHTDLVTFVRFAHRTRPRMILFSIDRRLSAPFNRGTVEAMVAGNLRPERTMKGGPSGSRTTCRNRGADRVSWTSVNGLVAAACRRRPPRASRL